MNKYSTKTAMKRDYENYAKGYVFGNMATDITTIPRGKKSFKRENRYNKNNSGSSVADSVSCNNSCSNTSSKSSSLSKREQEDEDKNITADVKDYYIGNENENPNYNQQGKQKMQEETIITSDPQLVYVTQTGQNKDNSEKPLLRGSSDEIKITHSLDGVKDVSQKYALVSSEDRNVVTNTSTEKILPNENKKTNGIKSGKENDAFTSYNKDPSCLRCLKKRFYSVTDSLMRDMYLMDESESTFLTCLEKNNMEVQQVKVLYLMKHIIHRVPFVNHLFYIMQFYNLLDGVDRLHKASLRTKNSRDNICTEQFLMNCILVNKFNRCIKESRGQDDNYADDEHLLQLSDDNFSDLSFESNKTVFNVEEVDGIKNQKSWALVEDDSNIDPELVDALNMLSSVVDVKKLATLMQQKQTKRNKTNYQHRSIADTFFWLMYCALRQQDDQDNTNFNSNSFNFNNYSYGSSRHSNHMSFYSDLDVDTFENIGIPGLLDMNNVVLDERLLFADPYNPVHFQELTNQRPDLRASLEFIRGFYRFDNFDTFDSPGSLQQVYDVMRRDRTQDTVDVDAGNRHLGRQDMEDGEVRMVMLNTNNRTWRSVVNIYRRLQGSEDENGGNDRDAENGGNKAFAKEDENKNEQDKKGKRKRKNKWNSNNSKLDDSGKGSGSGYDVNGNSHYIFSDSECDDDIPHKKCVVGEKGISEHCTLRKLLHSVGCLTEVKSRYPKVPGPVDPQSNRNKKAVKENTEMKHTKKEAIPSFETLRGISLSKINLDMHNKQSADNTILDKDKRAYFCETKGIHKLRAFDVALGKAETIDYFYYNLRYMYSYVYNLYDFIPLFFVQNILLHYKKNYKNINKYYYYDYDYREEERKTENVDKNEDDKKTVNQDSDHSCNSNEEDDSIDCSTSNSNEDSEEADRAIIDAFQFGTATNGQDEISRYSKGFFTSQYMKKIETKFGVDARLKNAGKTNELRGKYRANVAMHHCSQNSRKSSIDAEWSDSSSDMSGSEIGKRKNTNGISNISTVGTSATLVNDDINSGRKISTVYNEKAAHEVAEPEKKKLEIEKMEKKLKKELKLLVKDVLKDARLAKYKNDMVISNEQIISESLECQQSDCSFNVEKDNKKYKKCKTPYNKKVAYIVKGGGYYFDCFNIASGNLCLESFVYDVLFFCFIVASSNDRWVLPMSTLCKKGTTTNKETKKVSHKEKDTIKEVSIVDVENRFSCEETNKTIKNAATHKEEKKQNKDSEDFLFDLLRDTIRYQIINFPFHFLEYYKRDNYVRKYVPAVCEHVCDAGCTKNVVVDENSNFNVNKEKPKDEEGVLPNFLDRERASTIAEEMFNLFRDNLILYKSTGKGNWGGEPQRGKHLEIRKVVSTQIKSISSGEAKNVNNEKAKNTTSEDIENIDNRELNKEPNTVATDIHSIDDYLSIFLESIETTRNRSIQEKIEIILGTVTDLRKKYKLSRQRVQMEIKKIKNTRLTYIKKMTKNVDKNKMEKTAEKTKVNSKREPCPIGIEDMNRQCSSFYKKLKTTHVEDCMSNSYNRSHYFDSSKNKDSNACHYMKKKKSTYNYIPEDEERNVRNFEKHVKEVLNIKKVFYLFYNNLRKNSFIDERKSCEKLFKSFLKKFLKSANVYLQFVAHIVFSVFDYNEVAKKYLSYMHLYSDLNKYNILMHMLNIDKGFDTVYIYQGLQLVYHPYFYLIYKLYKLLHVDSSPVAMHNFCHGHEEFTKCSTRFKPSKNYYTVLKKNYKKKGIIPREVPYKMVYICLFCGSQVFESRPDVRGAFRLKKHSEIRKHINYCTGGNGLFLELMTSAVFCVADGVFASAGGIYIDKNGDEDISLRRGSNLYLSQERLSKMYDLIITGSVVQSRSFIPRGA